MAYLGIDIGGTKTLLCRLSDTGDILSADKFPTPQAYGEFVEALHKSIEHIPLGDVHAIGVGAPGRINRTTSNVVAFGNLPWKNVSIAQDIQALTHIPTSIENDAKLAGLYEAACLGEQYPRVLYVTVSTGIGIGFTVNGVIDAGISDDGGRGMIFEHNGQLVPWESYASGKAMYQEFGQRASDITDPKIWETVSRRLVPGFTQLISLLSPDAITIGGGVGAHYDKFQHIFEPMLRSTLSPYAPQPIILQAKNAEEAVIYGCYHYAKNSFASR